PCHIALDNAREKLMGEKAIGTTGRGIGPAYEDKIARRGLRVADLFNKKIFSIKLKEILDYHNFQLVNYYKVPAINYQKTLNDIMVIADILIAMTTDVSDLLYKADQKGALVMYEGAQGTLL
ncbi:MAG: adenylosuccinate synthetase, partial [Arsenophonus sp. ET-DL9-MAG3]